MQKGTSIPINVTKRTAATAGTLATACLLLTAVLLSGLGQQSYAKGRGRLPSTNIFSSPDADSDVVPTFIGSGGKPINADKESRMPGFDTVKGIPSLTKEQRKSIDDVQKDLNIRVSALRDHITTLQAELEVAKGHPEDKVVIQNKTLSKTDDLRRQINDLRKEIEIKQRDGVGNVVATILTDEQRELLAKMRRGEFVINGAQNADGKPGVIEHPARLAGEKTATNLDALRASHTDGGRSSHTDGGRSSHSDAETTSSSDTVATNRHSLFGGAKHFFNRALKGQ